MSIYGVENVIFLILDNPELAGRYRDLIARAILARARVLHNGDAWAPMALVDGRLLLRDKRRMLCLDVRAR